MVHGTRWAIGPMGHLGMVGMVWGMGMGPGLASLASLACPGSGVLLAYGIYI
jgi:hypothetical protein